MITRFVVLVFAMALTGGCAQLGLDMGAQTRRAQEYYESAQEYQERLATKGEKTWVAAAERLREIDIELANRRDMGSTWKFDSDDEEYHSYSIALAARVDAGVLPLHDYKALRAARLNAIQIRRASLRGQRQPVGAARGLSFTPVEPSSIETRGKPSLGVCMLSRQWTSGLLRSCAYNCGGSEFVQTIGKAEICPLSPSR